MDSKSMKVVSDLIKGLIHKDEGTILALQILATALIESGSLDEKLLLKKIDEAANKFKIDNINQEFSHATLCMGNALSPGRYSIKRDQDLLEILSNWNPAGNAH